MADFGKDILNKLLNTYENSKLSKQGCKKRISIKLTLKDKELSSYTARDSYNYRDRNDAILAEYERYGFICVVKDKDGDFEALILNVDAVEAIYQYLGRKNPNIELNAIIAIFNEQKYSGFIADFVNHCLDWIANKFSYPKQYFDSAEQLKQILKALNAMMILQTETRYRDFSVKVYSDSKVFEEIKRRVAKIVYDFDKNCSVGELNEDSIADILAEYNLVQNTTYAIIKGDVKISLNEENIDLRKLGTEFCLSDTMIEKLKICSMGVSKILTVENLTSFYQFDDEQFLVIYLGGFHNHTKRLLIKKVHEFAPNIEYCHYGDIDAGGIYILKHLRRKTAIDFKAYRMDIASLEANKCYWKKLTENDRKRLEKLKDVEFEPLINYMLENNCKLEQESMDLQ